MPDIQPKPWTGWAVFTEGGVVPWTVADTQRESIAAWMKDYRLKFGWEDSYAKSKRRIPTTVRRVVVTPAAGKKMK